GGGGGGGVAGGGGRLPPPVVGPGVRPGRGAGVVRPGGVSLDRLLVLTDRVMSAGAGLGLVVTVTEAVAGGARAIVLREKDLPAGERVALAGVLAAVLEPAGGTLIRAPAP